MKITLNKSEKEELELLHKSERDRRIADRIKAVLLRSEGWSQVDPSWNVFKRKTQILIKFS